MTDREVSMHARRFGWPAKDKVRIAGQSGRAIQLAMPR